VVLEGLRPDERRVRSRLPAAKGRALVFWAGEDVAEREPLDLVADTLRIDSDRGTCSVTWRKSFAVEHESHLSELRIVGAVQLGDAPVVWPPPSEVVRKVAVAIEEPASKPPGATTVQLGDEDLEVVSVRAALPPPPPVPAPAEPSRAQPMILGVFRLAVFSPDYEEHPEDPAKSTLVFRDKPSWAGEEDSGVIAEPTTEERPAPSLSKTLEIPGRAGAPGVVLGLAGTLVMKGSESAVDSLSPTAETENSTVDRHADMSLDAARADEQGKGLFRKD
jgi:hypothetical protein